MKQIVYCSGKNIVSLCGSLRHDRTSGNPISGLRHGEFGYCLGSKFVRKFEENSVQIIHPMGKYPNNV